MARVTDGSVLRLAFEARGRRGQVLVSVSRNHDPTSLGCAAYAMDFPVCRAQVEFDADGYNALLGWIQLVRMRPVGDESATEFVTDPLQVYDSLETPFGFYGLQPELFDAPSRSDRSRSLDWLAETFLCVAPSGPMCREALPVAGFSWGFTIDGGKVEIVKPRRLTHDAWPKHGELLRGQYRSWTFLDGDTWSDQPG